MRRLWPAVAALLFLLSICARAETPDPHYASPRIAPLVRQSAFVHGYLHGYEEGFSIADLDLQMGRAPRNPGKMREARAAFRYRSEFGPRGSFEAGFHQGLRVGYADGMAGRAFRAVDQIQRVMQLEADARPVTPPVAPPKPMVPHISAVLDGVASRYVVPPAKPPRQEPSPAPHASVFDQGFSSGYGSGQQQGLADARISLPSASLRSTCPPGPPASHSSRQEFCTAYVRGYALGYSDGYVNVAQPASAEAVAQSK